MYYLPPAISGHIYLLTACDQGGVKTLTASEQLSTRDATLLLLLLLQSIHGPSSP